MSFQLRAPMMGEPPAVARPPKGKRRKGLMIVGLLVLLGGLIGGGGIVAKSMSNYEAAVKSLARAPVGCTTTLVFDQPATFTLYAETTGKLGDLSGDCEANGRDYSHPGDKLPKVSMTLVSAATGDEVDLKRGVKASYKVDGYVGTGVRTVKIDEAGTYRLNVESDDSDFAVAIGKNPKSDSELLTTIGGSVALGGLVLGLTCLLLGLRRRRPAAGLVDVRGPAVTMPGWPPGPYMGATPTAPPGPPSYPGFRPPPPPDGPAPRPEVPPIREPEMLPFTGFAPPSPRPPTQMPPAPPPPPGPASAESPPTPPRRGREPWEDDSDD